MCAWETEKVLNKIFARTFSRDRWNWILSFFVTEKAFFVLRRFSWKVFEVDRKSDTFEWRNLLISFLGNNFKCLKWFIGSEKDRHRQMVHYLTSSYVVKVWKLKIWSCWFLVQSSDENLWLFGGIFSS